MIWAWRYARLTAKKITDNASDGSLIIYAGGDVERWRPICGSVEIVGRFGGPYVMPYENNRPIFICRNLRMPLDRLWGRLKRFR